MHVEMPTGCLDVSMGLELSPLAGEMDLSDKTGGWQDSPGKVQRMRRG